MNKPLLSIVIANYNYGRFLDEAIQSVANQEGVENVELIICDAASKDNSVEIIKKYANGLPPNTSYYDWQLSNNDKSLEPNSSNPPLITWWCSEKDGGQSVAFNKGFSHARGDWLTWLNADDLLMPGTLKAFEKLLVRHCDAQWITGNKMHFNSKTGKVTRVHWGPHMQPPFLTGNRAISAVFGPTTFFRKEIYTAIGPIDERLHYAMDSAYWARFTMAGVRQTRLNHFCWGFRDHEQSKTSGVQTDSVSVKRRQESELWHTETGYSYKVSFKNIWYLLWVLWRIFDGSWLVRAVQRWRFQGRYIQEVF